MTVGGRTGIRVESAGGLRHGRRVGLRISRARSRGRLFAVIVMALQAAPACRSADTAPATDAAAAVVERIVDGDTIDVVVDGREERVRLTGIDTPEVAHPARNGRPANDAECFGDEASAFTASLLPVGTVVRLERDVVGRDDYGRLLAYVYRADDGIFVNYEIVRQGYAQPLTIPPNVAHSELMVDAARAAEADDAGLWSACAN